MVTLSYRNRLPKQIIANRQSTIDLQSSKQDERVSKNSTPTQTEIPMAHTTNTRKERERVRV